MSRLESLDSTATGPSGRGPVVVADVVRSGFTEGHHYGSVVALAADGSVDWSVGDVVAPVLPCPAEARGR